MTWKEKPPTPKATSRHLSFEVEQIACQNLQELRNLVARHLDKAPHALWDLTTRMARLLETILMEACLVRAVNSAAKECPRSCLCRRRGASTRGRWASLGSLRSPTRMPCPVSSTGTGSWQRRPGWNRVTKRLIDLLRVPDRASASGQKSSGPQEEGTRRDARVFPDFAQHAQAQREQKKKDKKTEEAARRARAHTRVSLCVCPHAQERSSESGEEGQGRG